MEPLVSIVIANFNYGRFLEDAIRSIINQDGFDRCELIIVDGGSTDNSVDVIKRYEDRIAWWVSEKDKGQSDAFNKGFSHAQGRLLTWLNADDVMLPGTLRSVIDVSKKEDVEWITGGMAFCDSRLKILQMRIGASRPFFIPRRWLSMTIIGGPSSFFSAKRYKEIGGIDVNLCYAMDGDLWWRLFAAGVKMCHVNRYFWGFRLHEESKTSPALLTGGLTADHAEENEYLAHKNNSSKVGAHIGRYLLLLWKLLNGELFISYIDTKRFRGVEITKLEGLRR